MNNSNNHDSSHHHNGVKSPIDIEENSVGSDREVISDITFSSFSTVTPNILSKDAWREIARHIKKLFSNRNFVYLFICFTLFVSVANALVTLMNQFIGPHGYRYRDNPTKLLYEANCVPFLF